MTAAAAAHYNLQSGDRNERMAASKDRVNNHQGIGRYSGPPAETLSKDALTRVLDELENNQTNELIRRMGPVARTHRVLDLGCGRGGPSFALFDKTGCETDGVTISEFQLDFARKVAATKGSSDRTRFHLMNFTDLKFAPGTFDHAFNNETCMHAHSLDQLFKEVFRALKPGGTYTIADWPVNEEFGRSEYSDRIDANYCCKLHTRANYLEGLKRQGFEVLKADDLTEEAIPYWQVRTHWHLRSGIEDAFLEGHQSRRILYMMFSARKPT
jgi:geranyl diphosphate 2-C-methyltransferase